MYYLRTVLPVVRSMYVRIKLKKSYPPLKLTVADLPCQENIKDHFQVIPTHFGNPSTFRIKQIIFNR